jgi:hypothetical protein
MHVIFVRRGLVLDFVLRRRRDSTCSVGAAVLERLEVKIPDSALRGRCRAQRAQLAPALV